MRTTPIIGGTDDCQKIRILYEDIPMDTDNNTTRIPVISQDKPYGRPLTSFKISDLPTFLLPAIKSEDYFICLDEDVYDGVEEVLFEDDILLVRKYEDFVGDLGGMVLVGQSQDQLIISKSLPPEVKPTGVVIWSGRRYDD